MSPAQNRYTNLNDSAFSQRLPIHDDLLVRDDEVAEPPAEDALGGGGEPEVVTRGSASVCCS
jgi:hypothetical protein